MKFFATLALILALGVSVSNGFHLDHDIFDEEEEITDVDLAVAIPHDFKNRLQRIELVKSENFPRKRNWFSDVGNELKKTGKVLKKAAKQAVKATVDAGKTVVKATADAGKQVGKTTAAVGNKIGKTTVDVGEQIGKTSVAVGEQIGKTTVAVGEQIGKTTVAVGEQIGKAADDLKGEFQKFATKTFRKAFNVIKGVLDIIKEKLTAENISKKLCVQAIKDEVAELMAPLAFIPASKYVSKEICKVIVKTMKKEIEKTF